MTQEHDSWNDARSAEAVAALIREGLPELIAFCRKEILARPRLAAAAAMFRVAESDDWLRQATSLFQMCMTSCGPAGEWHDVVGELNFAAGLDVADANDCLCLLRDGVLQLLWNAVGDGRLPASAVPLCAAAILRGFDCALDAETLAYVRESQRHLSEVNKNLGFRQSMFERDLDLAQLVQTQFIPKGFRSDHFRAEVRYVPTTGIGGDHAGIFPASDKCLYVTICDVTGHGIASALVAEIVSSRLQPLLQRQNDPAFQYAVEPVEIIREMNSLFYHQFQHLGMLLSFFIARFDLDENTLTYSGAGHPPPLLCRRPDAEIDLVSQNIILGAHEDCVLDEGQSTIPLQRGDRVLFYTDGIIEAGQKNKMFGLDRLRQIVRSTGEASQSVVLKTILDEVHQVAQNDTEETEDDMSLILVDVLG